MNEDHAEVMILYCKAFSKATDTTEARMTSVDRYGFEMSATTGAGPRPIRLVRSPWPGREESGRGERLRTNS